MKITEVRVKLMDDDQDRLQAFCSVTLDGCFVIRDLKIIQGTKGPFVAMPSRKLTDRCPQCHQKNHLRARFCNECGAQLDDERAIKDGDGRAKLYADIAHPINSRCRDDVQSEILVAFTNEIELARQPGYICRYDDYGEDRYATIVDEEPRTLKLPAAGDSTRRLEPAAASGGPHFHIAAESKPREATVGNGAVRDKEEEDAFAAGLI